MSAKVMMLAAALGFLSLVLPGKAAATLRGVKSMKGEKSIPMPEQTAATRKKLHVIEHLKVLKQEAVMAEDFDRAKMLKAQLDAMETPSEEELDSLVGPVSVQSPVLGSTGFAASATATRAYGPADFVPPQIAPQSAASIQQPMQVPVLPNQVIVASGTPAIVPASPQEDPQIRRDWEHLMHQPGAPRLSPEDEARLYDKFKKKVQQKRQAGPDTIPVAVTPTQVTPVIEQSAQLPWEPATITAATLPPPPMIPEDLSSAAVAAGGALPVSPALPWEAQAQPPAQAAYANSYQQAAAAIPAAVMLPTQPPMGPVLPPAASATIAAALPRPQPANHNNIKASGTAASMSTKSASQPAKSQGTGTGISDAKVDELWKQHMKMTGAPQLKPEVESRLKARFKAKLQARLNPAQIAQPRAPVSVARTTLPKKTKIEPTGEKLESKKQPSQSQFGIDHSEDNGSGNAEQTGQFENASPQSSEDTDSGNSEQSDQAQNVSPQSSEDADSSNADQNGQAENVSPQSSEDTDSSNREQTGQSENVSPQSSEDIDSSNAEQTVQTEHVSPQSPGSDIKDQGAIQSPHSQDPILGKTGQNPDAISPPSVIAVPTLANSPPNSVALVSPAPTPAAGGGSEIDRYLAWIHGSPTLNTPTMPNLLR